MLIRLNLKLAFYSGIFVSFEIEEKFIFLAISDIKSLILAFRTLIVLLLNEELVLQPLFQNSVEPIPRKFILLVVKIQILHIWRGRYFWHCPR